MRFMTATLLILAAVITFFMQIEWLFLTLAIFAAIVLIAESGAPQEVPKALSERAEPKTQGEVIVLPRSSSGTEFYNNLITNIVTDALKKD